MNKIQILKLLDQLVGKMLCALLGESKTGKPVKTEMSRILIIRPGGIGDAVLLIPVINSIKNKYPDAKITAIAETRNGAIFSLCTDVDRVFYYDRPKEIFSALLGEYDIVIDTEQWHRLSAVVGRMTKAPVSIGFATNERKRLFTHPVAYSHDDYETESFFNLLTPLGIRSSSEIRGSFLIVPKEAKKKVEGLLEPVMGKKFVAIFPGASVSERRWGAVKFAAVAQSLGARGIPVVVVGGKRDASDGERISSNQDGLNLAGRTSLSETAAVIEMSSLLLSGDSGILHIGVGLGKPTVSLFGPGIANKWAPRGGQHRVLNKYLSCSPCTRFGNTPKCPINAKCLADIAVDEVVNAVEKLIFLH